MKRISRGFFVILILCLLSACVLAVDQKETAPVTLEGKSLLILGDSYCAGYGLSSPNDNWPNMVAERFGMTLHNDSVSGSTLTAGGNSPMVQRCMALPEGEYDIIIVQGGSNDWSIGAELGEKDSRDPYTLMGALNVILDQMAQRWPEAQLVCFTPWVSNGTVNQLGLETTAYTDAIKKLCRHREILCYDASNTVQNGIYMNRESFRAVYSRTKTDRWHLNAAGQVLFAEAFSRWLQENFCGVTTADRFVDMNLADYDMKLAVSRVYENEIMYGTSETLFSPSQAATRTTLAVTLHRIAGEPKVGSIALSDISPEDANYEAVCWAVQYGILPVETDAVSPQRTLTRAELVYSVYRFYELAGGEPLSTRSLGQYTDKDSIPEEQKLAWGWLLKQGLIDSVGDRLVPEGVVSRGQLAVALARLMEQF